jgi:hypothetical protein
MISASVDKTWAEICRAGKPVDYYGLDAKVFGVCPIGRELLCFEAVEDECDGYRSFLDMIISDSKPTGMRGPLATVLVQWVDSSVDGVILCDLEGDLDPYHLFADSFRGYELVDVDGSGHVWLRVGTFDADDYYPRFVCTHYPKEVEVKPIGLTTPTGLCSSCSRMVRKCDICEQQLHSSELIACEQRDSHTCSRRHAHPMCARRCQTWGWCKCHD